METVSFFENLKILLAMCTFLSTKQSPAGILSPTCLPYVLEQYSLFPKNIVCMLTLAKGAAAPWPGVAAELQRNIDQELGSDSGNVPHYVLLANAIRAEFGVEVWGVTPGAATDQFIRSMWQPCAARNRCTSWAQPTPWNPRPCRNWQWCWN